MMVNIACRPFRASALKQQSAAAAAVHAPVRQQQQRRRAAAVRAAAATGKGADESASSVDLSPEEAAAYEALAAEKSEWPAMYIMVCSI